MAEIRHVHHRWLAARPEAVAELIDQMWSGSARDAFPGDVARPFRDDPPGAGGRFRVGTRFGHGRFRFVVERWDGRVFRAAIATRGFSGHHGFVLEERDGGTAIVHDLRAEVAFPYDVVWKLTIAKQHDRAVERIFDRLAELSGPPRDPAAGAR